MKKFFTTTFACVLGTLIAGMILILIGVFSLTGFIAASATSDTTTYTPQKNTVLKLTLSGSLNERYNDDPLQNIFSQSETSVGLDKIRRAIKVAAENDNVTGIYIDARGMAKMTASSEEIRRLLTNFKEETGKWIYAYADNYTQSDYLIASVADTVALNNIGTVDIHGLGGLQMFYPGLLDKIGVEFQIFRVGTYKSAVEPYICEKMSDANREQTMAYLNATWDYYTDAITTSRGFSPEYFNAIADSITALRKGDEMLAMNLVDTLMYRPQFDEWLKTKVGIEKDKDINFASVEELASVPAPKNKSKNVVALVYAVGDITERGGNGINSEELVPELTKIRKDNNVKAVVLRVNSPGGSGYASEQIWAEIEAIKAAGKKVIVSMGDLAASGGYYISCNADHIFAESTTLTGSIGVFGAIPTAEKLMTEKLGLSFDEARTHKYGNVLDGSFIYKKFSPGEALAMQRSVEEFYDLFTRRCAEGRGMSQDDIKEIAEGRVWIGKTAVELGLVDELGSIDDAISYAVEESGLQDYKVAVYPKQKSSLDRIMEQLSSQTRLSIASMIFGEELSYLNTLQEIKNWDPIQCRMENIVIK